MRAATRRARAARTRKGASATELAFILPVLTLMALGCVDFGRFAYHYISIQNAARTGAEYGSTTPYTTASKAAWKTQIGTKAKAELEGQTGLVPGQVSVNVPDANLVPEGTTGLRRVRVEVTYTGFQTLVSWPGIPNSPTMRAAVEMRAIR